MIRGMDAVFRYDFNSPFAYLAAERIDELLPGVRWQPIAFAFLLVAQERIPWSMDGRREAGVAECERRASERGLPPVAWVDGWPRDSYSLDPLRAATVAGEHGLLREYSLAAFRRLFADGVPLGGETAVEVGVGVGLDEAALRAGMEGAGKEALRRATDEAIAAGVPGVPTVTVGGEHFWGDDRLEDAAAAAT